MRAFIYDKYGYYPPNETDTMFIFEGWDFSLETTKLTEEEASMLDEFIAELASRFEGGGAKLIKNRSGQYISETDFGMVVLIAVKKRDVSINDLLFLHRHPHQEKTDQKNSLSHMLELWEGKVAMIEEKAMPTVKIDDYVYVIFMEAAIHALGLAENAIQYLREAKFDFSDEIPSLAITHRRLEKLESFSFFNPLNMLLDSRVRDLAELFKYRTISCDELLNIVGYYQLTPFEATILFARILFPTPLFDRLEDHYSQRIDVRTEIIAYHGSLRERMQEIKKIHSYLVTNYRIRPISWLNTL